MTRLPENRRHNEPLRSYVLASQMVAAIAEMILGDDDRGPYARALRHALQAQDNQLARLRAEHGMPAAPATRAEPAEYRVAPVPAIADSPDLDPPADDSPRQPHGVYADILAAGIRPHVSEEV